MDPVEGTKVNQIVIDRIVSMIGSGELSPGEQLPAQRELAIRLGVGMSTVREALLSLSAIGLVDVRHGKGTFVSEKPTEVANKRVQLALLLGPKEVAELLETRQFIEGAIVILAAQKATDEDISALNAAYMEMEQAVRRNDMTALERADMAFHMCMTTACHNDVMTNIMHSLESSLAGIVRATPYSPAVLAQHRELYEAIRDHNGDHAFQTIQQVIRTTAQSLDLDYTDQASPLNSPSPATSQS